MILRILFFFMSGFLVLPVQADLQAVFTTEKSFLLLQARELKKQQQDLMEKTSQQKTQLQRQVKALQAELANAQVQNEALGLELQELQKEMKAKLQSENGLEVLYKKVTAKNAGLQKAAQLTPLATDQGPVGNAAVGTAEIVHEMQKTIELWMQLQSDEQVAVTVKGEQGEWQQGTALRIGSIGALFGDKILAPLGAGILGVLPARDAEVNFASAQPLYVFTDAMQAARIQKPLGFFEAAANLLPALVLGLIFLLVAGLFAVFVRE